MRELPACSIAKDSVSYEDTPTSVVSVELAKIEPAGQLELLQDVGNFWESQSLEDLADSQGVGVIDRIEVLRDETVSDKEADALLAALGL